jgi:hypothetical protein
MLFVVFPGLSLVGLVGCGSKQKPADAGLARATLQRALDAWQAGTSLEDFEKSTPPVVVSDPVWDKGTRLVKYDLTGEEKASGFDLRFSGKLSLQDGAGKQTQQNATWTVSTSPRLVIHRMDESE